MSLGSIQRVIIGSLVGASALALAACGEKAPEGQVVATINGQEITLPELNAEAQAANVPDGADRKQVMPQILQQVINRKLLVDVAKEKGIDKTGDYLVQKRRNEELLLAELVAKQQVGTLAVPTGAEIDKFIAENPTVFAQRTRYALDQIRFPRPSDQKVLLQLQPAKTLDEVGVILTKLGIKFERGAAALDSGVLPPPIMSKIKSLPAGEPFVLPQGQLLFVSVITGAQPIAVPADAARQIAGNALRQQKAAKAVEDTVTTAKKAAKIVYQPGFAPPAPGTTPKLPAGAGAAPAAN
jgi:peptidyl-prolyl cis-trans isomerase C